MQMGDVVIEFDGKKIEESDDLPLVVARTPVGKHVQVKVIRAKEEMNLAISVGELKEEEVVSSTEERKNFGLTVQNVTPEVAESLGLDRAEGVVVSSVAPRSVADRAGFRRGDTILEIDRKRIKNLSDFKRQCGISRKSKSSSFWLTVERRQFFLRCALQVNFFVLCSCADTAQEQAWYKKTLRLRRYFINPKDETDGILEFSQK
jgi:serine protease Do